MSNNVVFPESFASAGLAQVNKRERDELGQQEALERRRRQVSRLREIESAPGRLPGVGKKGYIFKRRSDRVAAALEVGALVRQARDRNHTVKAIRAALPGTTRLDRYMLAPDRDAALAAQKDKKLLQRVSGYLDVAEAVARLTHQDADALKIQVLSGTSLWSQPATTLSQDDPRASHLAEELIAMGRAVVRRAGLNGVLSRARRIPGSWDIEREVFKSSQDWPTLPGLPARSAMACLYQQAYLDAFEHWTEAPPLPSVPLVRRVHAVFITQVRLETAGWPERLQGVDAQDDGFAGEVCSAWLELSREIRLALGPTTSPDQVGPMFESRAHVRIGFPEPTTQLYDLSPGCTLKPVDTLLEFEGNLAVFQVWLNGGWRRVALCEPVSGMQGRLFGEGGYALAWSPNPLDPQIQPIEHWYVSWFAINSESVRHWLDRPPGVNDTQVLVHDGDGTVDRPTWYALNSTGHQIERSLATGGLEQPLAEAVKHLNDMLDTRETEWRAEVDPEHAARMASWED